MNNTRPANSPEYIDDHQQGQVSSDITKNIYRAPRFEKLGVTEDTENGARFISRDGAKRS